MDDSYLPLVCQVLTEGAFEPIIVCDDIMPLDCNDRVAKLFGFNSKTELLSQTMQTIIQTNFNPSTIANDNGDIRPAKFTELIYANVVNAGSVKQTANVKVKPWKFNEKQLYSIVIRDIPIIKLAHISEDFSEPILNPPDAALKGALVDAEIEPQIQARLLNQFSQMANALPSLVWVITQTGEVLYQNSRVLEVWGVDTTKDAWQDCIHPDDIPVFIPQWGESLRRGVASSFEVRYRNIKQKPNSDGEYTYRLHLLQTIPILNNMGTVKQFVCSAVDVQDLKEAEAEKQRLISSEKLAIDASKLKSAFLSMMSHEIRTPLFGIVGNTCLLMDTEIDDIQKEYIENIDGSAKLMMAVIQDILDFSRIEAGKLRVLSEPFSFNRVLNICAGMVRAAADRKRLTFVMPPLDTEVKAMGDSMRILQVLTNLASNAIKFTRSGSVAIDFVHHVDEDNFLNVKVSVKDTGIGISPDLQEKLFTPWVQGDSSNRRLYGGSGLGLAISKALLDMMGGKINLSSELGKGTCFWVELKLPALSPDYDLNGIRSQTGSPMSDAKFEFYNYQGPIQKSEEVKPQLLKIPAGKKEVPATPLKLKAKKTTKKANSSSKPKKFRVLLAEDNPINQAILKRFLEKMGCVDYVLASDGQLALEEYERQPIRHYDLILLDQSMPRMDGDMVCRHIRKRDPIQIVISVSANALLSDRNHFSEIGMNDHIPKPVDFSSFSLVLTHWLDKVPQLYFNQKLPNMLAHPSPHNTSSNSSAPENNMLCSNLAAY